MTQCGVRAGYRKQVFRILGAAGDRTLVVCQGRIAVSHLQEGGG